MRVCRVPPHQFHRYNWCGGGGGYPGNQTITGMEEKEGQGWWGLRGREGGWVVAVWRHPRRDLHVTSSGQIAILGTGQKGKNQMPNWSYTAPGGVGGPGGGEEWAKYNIMVKKEREGE